MNLNKFIVYILGLFVAAMVFGGCTSDESALAKDPVKELTEINKAAGKVLEDDRIKQYTNKVLVLYSNTELYPYIKDAVANIIVEDPGLSIARLQTLYYAYMDRSSEGGITNPNVSSLLFKYSTLFKNKPVDIYHMVDYNGFENNKGEEVSAGAIGATPYTIPHTLRELESKTDIDFRYVDDKVKIGLDTFIKMMYAEQGEEGLKYAQEAILAMSNYGVDEDVLVGQDMINEIGNELYNMFRHGENSATINKVYFLLTWSDAYYKNNSKSAADFGFNKEFTPKEARAEWTAE